MTKAPPAKVIKTPSLNYNSIFSESQVDEKAVRIKYRQPKYPTRARRRNISGKVVIDCVITKDGKVANARVTKAYPKGYFESACMSVLDRLEYKPAMKNGRKVMQRTILTFDFGLQK